MQQSGVQCPKVKEKKSWFYKNTFGAIFNIENDNKCLELQMETMGLQNSLYCGKIEHR